MATIRRDESRGCWRADVTIGNKLGKNGEKIPVRKSFRGKTKKEVQQKIDEYKLMQGQGIEKRDQYFGILADSWIENFFLQDGNLSGATKRTYHDPWRKYLKPLDMYNMPLNEITALTIQTAYNYIFEHGCPPAQIKKIHKLMRKFYAYVEMEGYGRDVTRSLLIPKKQNKTLDEDQIVVWTDDEIKKIFNGFDSADNRFRLRFLVVLAYYTGCRIGELLALTYDDISEKGIKVNKQMGLQYGGIKDGKVQTSLGMKDTKTQSSVRTMPTSDRIMEEFAIHKKWHKQEMLEKNYRTDFLFTTDTGLPLDHNNIKRALFRYYDRVGVPQKPIHTYRHTFATNLCRTGIPIQTASALLGHSDISVTAKYYVSVLEDEKLNAIKQLETILSQE